jgi:hypothetical protein
MSQTEKTPSTLSGEQLETLTGLTDRRIRQIAKMGYFMPPVRGLYDNTETIRGLFKYYREGRESSSAALNEAKLQKLKADAEMAEVKLAEAKREVIAFTDAQGAFDRLLGRWHQLITQKLETETPPRVVGKDITAIRAEVKAIHDEIAEIVNFKFQDAKKEISAV